MDVFKKVERQGYYIIAEIGVNYYDVAKKEGLNLMEAAKLMVKEAKDAGVDAVKFQSYKAGTLASRYSPSYWDTSEESTTSQYELFKKFDRFGKTDYEELSGYCKGIGVEFLSTPFDFESADYLNEIMSVYKVSSSDLTNLPFIQHICQKGKPILVSTGASDGDEIEAAISAIEDAGISDIAIMHCILEYPTPYEHANLGMIGDLRKRFPNHVIGYSDHTRPDECMDVLKTAWLLGARIMEKHFTLDKGLSGNDHYHAMDPDDVRRLKKGLEFLKTIYGQTEKRCLQSEAPARKNARRSIVSTRDIEAGETITSEMLTFKRPGHGVGPNEIDNVIGRKAKERIPEDTPLRYDMMEME